MTAKEMALASKLLSIAADEFGNHGCNDMDMSLVENWTPEERVIAARSFSAWNGGPEEERRFECIRDSSWMAYLAAKLKDLAAETDSKEAA